MTTRPPRRDDQPSHDHTACQQAKEEAVVALLGGHEPPRHVHAHLGACPPCQVEYRQLSALPALLGAARRTVTTSPSEPPRPQLLDRLMAEVSRRRGRRRRLVTGLAGVAAAATATAVAAVSLGGWPTAAPDGATVAASSPATGPSARAPAVTTISDTAVLVASGTGKDPATGATAQVAVRADGAGSAVSISVRRWPRGKPCRMIVYDADGGFRQVGIWTVDAADESTYVEAVALPPARIARVELVDDRTGRALIDVLVQRV